MSLTVAAAKQAEKLRIDGNSYFKKDRFGAAIDAYTEVFLGLLIYTSDGTHVSAFFWNFNLLSYGSFRLLRCVLMFRSIGPTGLCATASGSTYNHYFG